MEHAQVSDTLNTVRIYHIHSNTQLLLPDAVQDSAVREDPYIQVWLKDGVESSNFFISKKCVRHPDFGSVSHGEVPDLI